jgi:hypothetical protein
MGEALSTTKLLFDNLTILLVSRLYAVVNGRLINSDQSTKWEPAGKSKHSGKAPGIEP